MARENRVFIAYQSEDAGKLRGRSGGPSTVPLMFHEFVRHELETCYGRRVPFLDIWELDPGHADYRDEIVNRAQRCAAMILLVGPNFVPEHGWNHREVAAFAEAQSPRRLLVMVLGDEKQRVEARRRWVAFAALAETPLRASLERIAPLHMPPDTTDAPDGRLSNDPWEAWSKVHAALGEYGIRSGRPQARNQTEPVRLLLAGDVRTTDDHHGLVERVMLDTLGRALAYLSRARLAYKILVTPCSTPRRQRRGSEPVADAIHRDERSHPAVGAPWWPMLRGDAVPDVEIGDAEPLWRVLIEEAAAPRFRRRHHLTVLVTVGIGRGWLFLLWPFTWLFAYRIVWLPLPSPHVLVESERRMHTVSDRRLVQLRRGVSDATAVAVSSWMVDRLFDHSGYLRSAFDEGSGGAEATDEARAEAVRAFSTDLYRTLRAVIRVRPVSFTRRIGRGLVTWAVWIALALTFAALALEAFVAWVPTEFSTCGSRTIGLDGHLENHVQNYARELGRDARPVLGPWSLRRTPRRAYYGLFRPEALVPDRLVRVSLPGSGGMTAALESGDCDVGMSSEEPPLPPEGWQREAFAKESLVAVTSDQTFRQFYEELERPPLPDDLVQTLCESDEPSDTRDALPPMQVVFRGPASGTRHVIEDGLCGGKPLRISDVRPSNHAILTTVASEAGPLVGIVPESVVEGHRSAGLRTLRLGRRVERDLAYYRRTEAVDSPRSRAADVFLDGVRDLHLPPTGLSFCGSRSFGEDVLPSVLAQHAAFHGWRATGEPVRVPAPPGVAPGLDVDTIRYPYVDPAGRLRTVQVVLSGSLAMERLLDAGVCNLGLRSTDIDRPDVAPAELLEYPFGVQTLVAVGSKGEPLPTRDDLIDWVCDAAISPPLTVVVRPPGSGTRDEVLRALCGDTPPSPHLETETSHRGILDRVARGGSIGFVPSHLLSTSDRVPSVEELPRDVFAHERTLYAYAKSGHEDFLTDFLLGQEERLRALFDLDAPEVCFPTARTPRTGEVLVHDPQARRASPVVSFETGSATDLDPAGEQALDALVSAFADHPSCGRWLEASDQSLYVIGYQSSTGAEVPGLGLLRAEQVARWIDDASRELDLELAPEIRRGNRVAGGPPRVEVWVGRAGLPR